jgi:hypothetical protein
MPKLSKTACSGAFIHHCRATGKEIKGCFCDDSPNRDNYRGELVGGLGPLLLLKAAFSTSAATGIDQATIQLSSQSLYCDNKGVISHGNDPPATLRSEQPQADLIRLLKSYTRKLPCNITWIHMSKVTPMIKYHLKNYPYLSSLTLDATNLPRSSSLMQLPKAPTLTHSFPLKI